MKSFLFSNSHLTGKGNLALFILRVSFGTMMLFGHGWGKLAGFGEMSPQFADPYGFGAASSLGLAVFAEFFCSLALIFGIFTRLSTIPLIITMLTAVFVIHGASPYQKQELGLVYLMVYVVIFIAGPGRYSLDALITGKKR